MMTLDQLAAVDRYRSAADFTKTLGLVMRAGGAMGVAANLAHQDRAATRIQGALKAAVAATTLSSAGDDFGILAAAFLNSLATASAFDYVRQNGAIVLPLYAGNFRVVSSIIGDADRAEAGAAPVGRLALTPGALTPAWATAIIAATDELLRLGSPALTAAIEGELRRAVIAAVDSRFLGDLAAGATSVAAVATVAESIAAAIGAMSLDSSSKLVLVAPSAALRNAALHVDGDGRLINPDLTVSGGTVAGIRVIGSDYTPKTGSPGGDALLLDASQIAVSSGELEVHRSMHADLEMSDLPSMTGAEAGSPSAPVPAEMVSMFQVNTTALRVRRRIAYAAVRAGAVVTISSVAW